MKDYNRHIVLVAMSNIKGIGPAFFKKAVINNSSFSSNYLQEIKEIAESNNKQIDDETISFAIENAKEIIAICNEEHISIIDFTNEDYPIALKELKDPPPILYCKGNLELLYQKTVCIIGTREPNKNGIIIAERIGSYFSDTNWVICNGLADGIDNFTIQTGNKLHHNIIGVLAGGLNYNTKKTLLKRTSENAQKTIESGGLLLAETPPDKKEDTFSVVKSCRIQAGLSHGLILIQSSINGGSKFAIKAFCETQRPIGVVSPIPFDYENPTYQANKDIIENKKKGLSKFTELKEDKIQTKTIYIIKSKDDYREFENILNYAQKNIEQTNKTLLFR